MSNSSWAATARLAWRGARHDRKRTVFVMALIAIPVAAAVVVGAITTVTTPDPTAQTTVRMGKADLIVETYQGGPADDSPGILPVVEVSLDDLLTDPEVAAQVTSTTPLQTAFVDRRWLADDGVTFDVLDVAAYDPSVPLTAGMLSLTDGDWPDAGEVAITRRLAELAEVAIGEKFQVDDDAPAATVVGLMAMPTRLDALNVLAAPGELATILPPDAFITDALLLASDDVDSTATAISAVGERVRGATVVGLPRELRDALEASGVGSETIDRLTQPEVDALLAELPTMDPDELAFQAEMAWEPLVNVTTREESLMTGPPAALERPATLGALVAAALLAEVAMIAGAAYAAGIRRRLREVGLLSAQGADTSQIRRIVVGEAVVAGLLGAAMGGLVGVIAVVAGADLIERLTKVPVIGIPVGPAAVLAPALVGVVAATVAAWLPGRTASRVPTLTALQGRMPESAPRAWVAPLGVVMAVVGAALVVVGRDSGADAGMTVAVAGGGVVLMIAGAALLAGPLVALVGLVANRLPPTPRLVVRDAARQRTRAAAAVAASMVVLVGPVVAAAAIERQDATTALLGLAPDGRQVVLEAYAVTDREDSAVMPTEVVDEVTALLPGSRRATLHAYDAMVDAPGSGDPGSDWWSGGYMVAEATDELVTALGNDEVGELVADGTPVLLGTQWRERTVGVTPIQYSEWEGDPVEGGGVDASAGVHPPEASPMDSSPVEVTEVPVAVARNLPRLWLDQATIARLDLVAVEEPMTLIVAAEPLTGGQANDVRNAARAWDGDTGVEAGVVDPGAAGSVDVLLMGLGATLVVMLLVVGLVTALAAAESRRDLRLVTAVGAAPALRRRFLGLQTWLHVVLGSLLAVPLGMLLYQVSAGSDNRVTSSLFGTYDGTQLDVPWLAVAVLVVGLPILLGLLTAAVVRSSPTQPPRRMA